MTTKKEPWEEMKSISSDALGTSETTPLNEKPSKAKGLTMFSGTLFMIGELISITFLVLPRSMVDMGVAGLPLLIVLSGASCYTAVLLTRCWDMVEERHKLYDHVNDPYPTIAYYACGKIGRIIVLIANTISLNGVVIVSIIYSGQLLQHLFQEVNSPFQVSFCYWMLIFAAGLIPFTWFGSPKNMGPIAFFSYTSLFIACILAVVGFAMIIPAVPHPTVYPSVTITSFMLGFGKLTFANKGHIGLLTIQVDMDERRTFFKTVIIAFTVVLLIYLPVAYMGYFIFGAEANVDILVTMNKFSPGSKIVLALQILVVIHNAAVAIIYFNPVFQQLEDTFGVENAFGVARVAIRSVLLVFIVFICETIPRFGNVLSMLGGSTLTLLVYILPLVFYEKLCNIKDGKDTERGIGIKQRIFNYFIILVAVFAGIGATYSSMWKTFSPETWIPPCYVKLPLMNSTDS